MKHMRSILAVLLSLVLIACCVPVAFALGGSDGSIKWSYDVDTDTLTISPGSTMKEYTTMHPAWWNLHDLIRSVVIESGVTKPLHDIRRHIILDVSAFL